MNQKWQMILVICSLTQIISDCLGPRTTLSVQKQDGREKAWKMNSFDFLPTIALCSGGGSIMCWLPNRSFWNWGKSMVGGGSVWWCVFSHCILSSLQSVFALVRSDRHSHKRAHIWALVHMSYSSSRGAWIFIITTLHKEGKGTPGNPNISPKYSMCSC